MQWIHRVSSIAPSSSEVLLNGTLEKWEKDKRRSLAVLRSLNSGGLWLGLYGCKTDIMKATMVEHSVARWLRGSSTISYTELDDLQVNLKFMPVPISSSFTWIARIRPARSAMSMSMSL